MQLVTSSMSTSLDGFISGPEHLDPGFYRVQDWVGRVFAWRDRQGLSGGEHDVDSDIFAEMLAETGAYVMGRNMFDVGEEPWGDDPPFGAPVFVVTHRPREVLERKGAPRSPSSPTASSPPSTKPAPQRVTRTSPSPAAAKIVQAAISAGLLDELHLHIAPVLLGAGMPLFAEVPEQIELERISVVESPQVTHVTYRLGKPQGEPV